RNAGVMQRLHEVQGGERGVLRGLDHGGVASDQRGEKLPRRDRHGEVPGRDHGADAQRLANGHRELIRQLRRDGRPEQTAAFAGGVVAAVDGLLHVAACLLDDLAHLAGHVAGVFFLARDEQLRSLVQHLGAARRRHQTPLLERLFGGLDGVVYVFLARFLEDADHFARVGGIEVLKGAAGAALHPLAANKVLEDLGFSGGVNASRFLFHSSHKIALRSELQTFNAIGSHQYRATRGGSCSARDSPPESAVAGLWMGSFFGCVYATNNPYLLLSLVSDVVQRFRSGVCLMASFPYLDIAIGISFIYLLMALVCSTVNETIAGVINSRGKTLEKGILSLLHDTDFKKKFYD